MTTHPARMCFLLLLFPLLVFPLDLTAQEQVTVLPPPSAAKAGPSPSSDRVLVRFRAEVDEEFGRSIHRSVGALQVRRFHSVPGLTVAKLPAGVKVDDALRAYRRVRQVLYAEPDYKVQALDRTPNDPRFSQLWGLNNTGQTGGVAGADIAAPRAWDITTGSNSVVVGVIDTGVSYQHPDLAGNIFRNTSECTNNQIDDDHNGYIDDCYGIDTFNQDSDPLDDEGHGTHVAGTIGAVGNNALGVVGVNWQVKIVACKFLGSEGWGYTSDAVECFDYFAWLKDHGVNLVATNNSWGGGGQSQALDDAIARQRDSGILCIAAAGNDGWDNDANPSHPSSSELGNVIAVAATDDHDALASFSNFGRKSVDVGAPGVAITSTYLSNGYAIGSGTSMATPHVTGVVALLKAATPTLSWQQLRNLILLGGDPIPALEGRTVTGRRLNAYRALHCTDGVVQDLIRPNTSSIFAAVTAPVQLEFLSVQCPASSAPVSVTVQETGAVIELHDDGQAPDAAAGDGVFAGTFSASAVGIYTLAFPNGQTLTVYAEPGYVAEPTAYQWREITGTPLDWNDSGAVPMGIVAPFPVRFADTSVGSWFVSAYGVMATKPYYPYIDAANAPLPLSVWNDPIVAPWWDAIAADYNSTATRRVYWGVVGEAPERELVIEWRNVSVCTQEAGVRFQVVFSEAKSDVIFNYADTVAQEGCAENGGGSATVGIQLTREQATQFSFNSPVLQDRTALRWTMQGEHQTPQVTSLSPARYPAGSAEISLILEGSGFTYSSQVLWNGQPLSTTRLGRTMLRVAVPAERLADPGTVMISVRNPDPGGDSVAVPFVITERPTLTLTSPNGGEAWVLGSTHTITWSYTGEVENTSVWLWPLQNGQPTTFGIAVVPMGSGGKGSYEWTVGASTTVPGTGYTLRIACLEFQPLVDESNAPFEITPFPVTVLSPNGGETLVPGTTHRVRWSYGTLPADLGWTPVELDLLQNGQSVGHLATVSLGDPPEYDWPIPAGLSGSGYRVQVSGSTLRTDTSDGDFRISAPQATVAVTGPNGGQSYAAGSALTVAWTYTGSPGNLRLELLKGGVTVQTIAASVAPTPGSYRWAIPATTAAGTDYRVRVTSVTDASVSDSSDADFRITRTGITVVAPNGGESWNVGSSQTIRWSYSGTVGAYVRIELLKAGIVNRTIAATASIGSGGNGQYTWMVPATQPLGADYRIRVRSTTYTTYTDTGDGNFSIDNTSVRVTAPNGGETWRPGTAHNITWTSSGSPGANVRIELLKAGGLHSTLAASAPTRAGSFAWTVPAEHARGTDFAVRITSTSSSFTDSSDALFTIDERYALTVSKTGTGSGTVTSSPTGITCGASCSASFSSGTQVTLSATPTSGHTFAGWGGACSGTGACVVTMNGDANVTATFTAPATGITVLAPNGGERWQRGTSHAIQWSYSGTVGTYVRVQLYKNGVLVRTIASFASVGTGGRGSLNWVVPTLQVAGSDYRIRVTSGSNGTYTDQSDANFSIF